MTLLAVVTCAALLGSISGRVTDADSGAAITGARIALAGPGITSASDSLVTDGDGRFRRDGLAPGRYELSVAARGYVTASGRWRESITLDAERMDGEASFRLHRGAVLAGFISDDEGEPLANLAVELIPAPEPGLRVMRLTAMQTAATDDRGYYRFWGLRTGRYLVAVRPSVADLAAGRAENAPATTFYPGTLAPSQAEPIAVSAAAELDSINFRARSGRLSRLMIRVVDASGDAPPDVSVSITEAGSGRIGAFSGFPTGARGAFVSPQMPPGDYVILAVAGRSGPSVSYAAQPVTIVGDGAEMSIILTTGSAARLTGEVVVEKGASPPPPGSLAVSGEAADDEELRSLPAPPLADPFAATVRGDGRFSTAVLPGRRIIRASGLPPGWAVLSVTRDGRDLVDREVAFLSGDAVNVRIVISDRLGTVTGTVATSGATAVIWSTDRTQWTVGTRAVRTATTDQNGRFRIVGVRPGDYYAAVIKTEWSDRLHDPAFLETLTPTAVTLNVGAGDSPLIGLTVMR